MPRLRHFVLFASLLIGVSAAPAEERLAARDAADSQPADPVFAVVMGLSANDLLNVRREASPLGKTLGRLPNGALVDRQECKKVKGYEWCWIETIDGEALSGWTPARYLFVQSDDETRTGALATAEPDGQDTNEEANDAAAASPAPGVPLPQPAPRAEAKADAPGDDLQATIAETPEPELPAGLEARFAGGDARPITELQKPSSDLLALADDTAGRSARVGGTTASAGIEASASAPGIPVPTPRPGRTGEGAETDVPPAVGAQVPDPVEQPPEVALETEGPSPANEQSVALAAAPVDELPANWAVEAQRDAGRVGSIDAAGGGGKDEPVEPFPLALAGREPTAAGIEIPCARYIGQPMGRCIMRVARGGRDTADVTIDWPDGGSRTIAFRDGAPASANTRGEVRVEREGTLNMVRIGVAERFEILDSLVFDD